MTDKDAILAQFFEQQEPPAYDATFVAAALTRAQRKRNASAVLLWVGVEIGRASCRERVYSSV